MVEWDGNSNIVIMNNGLKDKNEECCSSFFIVYIEK